jgi:hypothetical protein
MRENDAQDPRRWWLPDGARPARLVVCERTGAWAVALRRELPAGFRLWPTRSLAEAWDGLAVAPASFLVLELGRGQAEALVARLLRLEHDWPLARAGVVADRSLAGYEWLMRQAGAMHFTCSPRHLAGLADAARRHLAAVPQPDREPLAKIRSSLPWGENESA